MYEDYYGFSGMPFQLTPDNRFFFGSEEHSKAMAFLQYGIAQQEGFVVVTGEIGAGKTTLVEHLLANLETSKFAAVRVVTTQLGGYDLLSVIAAAFGVGSDGVDKGTLIERVKQQFVDLWARDRRPLVIVDEAQSLTTEAVEELRMLSNLSVGSHAPFQGILLGQPEFRAVLSRPNLEQFRQRVIASCHLGALSPVDTRHYIEYRLTQVGWTNDPLFSDSAFDEIFRCTNGIPRRINTLCSRLLLLGFLEGKHTIEATQVVGVAREMENELGPLTTVGTSRPPMDTQNSDVGAENCGQSEDMLLRLVRVERATERHDRAISRVLELALKYLPAQISK
ncbi:MAG TPA: XrtA/PEP-CTERM system-associated ATPase [Rhizomicrobium sp.]|jgi:putative secretion ATPase (PEP-CTERM system associated)